MSHHNDGFLFNPSYSIPDNQNLYIMKTNFFYGCKTSGEVRNRYDELSRVFNPTNSKEPNEMINTTNAE